MTTQSDRSMNDELFRGMTDGKIRNLRPDSANADYSSAVDRSRQLHPINYGTFGVPDGTLGSVGNAALPDWETRAALERLGIPEY